jgi:hypothetical protein
MHKTVCENFHGIPDEFMEIPLRHGRVVYQNACGEFLPNGDILPVNKSWEGINSLNMLVTGALRLSSKGVVLLIVYCQGSAVEILEGQKGLPLLPNPGLVNNKLLI